MEDNLEDNTEWDSAGFNSRLAEAAGLLDRAGTTALCDQLIRHLHHHPEAYPEKDAKRILQILRNKRFFELMQKVADELIQSGQDRPQIQRQYAQALLDLGQRTSAIAVLERLDTRTTDDVAENAEARGLLGRAYKQLYTSADEPLQERNRQNLWRAARAYYEVYKLDPARYYWQGINTVALLSRAARDGVAFEDFPDAQGMAARIAEEILQQIASHVEPDAWALGTAIEACVALDLLDEAMKWLARYISAPDTDAFELASTHRQLTEVWQLDMQSMMGRVLLPVLRAELLKREGGEVEISASDLKAGRAQPLDTYGKFEKVFGAGSYVTFEWYQMGIERCRAVACVREESGAGFGTGFLVKGADLHPSLGKEFLLLTNAHVVSDDPQVRGALQPDEAFISFEALGLNDYQVQEIIWTSPPAKLDATLIRLDRPVSGVEPYPIAPRLPKVDGQQRTYVVGHPKGGKLSFSLHDNLLLDHQDPRIHYRTPTEGGSSGSPVFNQQWRLLGIHHMGSDQMPRLNGHNGRYEANEGIWIGAIKQALAIKLGEG